MIDSVSNTLSMNEKNDTKYLITESNIGIKDLSNALFLFRNELFYSDNKSVLDEQECEEVNNLCEKINNESESKGLYLNLEDLRKLYCISNDKRFNKTSPFVRSSLSKMARMLPTEIYKSTSNLERCYYSQDAKRPLIDRIHLKKYRISNNQDELNALINSLDLFSVRLLNTEKDTFEQDKILNLVESVLLNNNSLNLTIQEFKYILKLFESKDFCKKDPNLRALISRISKILDVKSPFAKFTKLERAYYAVPNSN